jgi:hypothetical protein
LVGSNVKKNRTKTNKAKRKNRAPAVAPQATKRSFLKSAAYLAGGAVVLSGIGYLGLGILSEDLAEQDLSIVGSGVPVIVQVHNPTCSICLALQKETRAALKMMEEEDLSYRVANISSTTGSNFASKHRSSYATLLLFDGSGTVTQRIEGATDRVVLYDTFMAHIGKSQ